MKNCKRLFSCVLIVCMLLSLSPAIFAADDSDQPVNIGPGESVTVGNVTVTESGVDAVSASAAGGENSTLTVEGNVTQEGSDFYPVNAYTNGDGSTATVTVTGDVSGEGTSGDGVYTYTQEGSTVVEIGGDVSAQASGEGSYGTGVYAYASSESGSTEISIGGDVTVSGEYASGIEAFNQADYDVYNEETGTFELVEVDSTTATNTVSVEGDVTVSGGSYGSGVDARSEKGGSTTVSVGGDVTVEAEGNGTGVHAQSWTNSQTDVSVDGSVSVSGNGTQGVSAYAAENSQLSVSVGGDVSVSDENSTGVAVFSEENSKVSVTIGGDVAGGIVIGSNGEPSEIKVTVEGTVSSGENDAAAVFLDTYGNMSEGVQLILWQAELNENGNVVGTYVYDPEDFDEEYREEVEKVNEENAQEAAKLEENILYIVKYEQLKEGGTLSLSGTTQVDGYDVAKEGDSVILRIAVEDGYKLNAAYNGKNERVALLQDADGNYYIVVPKGGGVYLSADVSKLYHRYAVKKLLAETDNKAEATVKDKNGKESSAKLNVRFFDDNSFEIRVNGVLRIKGDYKFAGNDLVFVLKDGTEIKANDQGLFVFELDGGTISFALKDEVVAALKS